jgi:hypothetical protein
MTGRKTKKKNSRSENAPEHNDPEIDSQIMDKKISIVTNTDEESIKIIDALNKAFTTKELKSMIKNGPLLIMVDESLIGSGEYFLGHNIIRLNPTAGYGTIIHEAIHHLRKIDRQRTDPVSISHTRFTPTKDEIELKERCNAEESATTAETFIRLHQEDDEKYVSYYAALPDIMTEEDLQKTIASDRELFRGSKNKPLRGKYAVESLIKNFEKSNIPSLQMDVQRSARQFLMSLRNNEKI